MGSGSTPRAGGNQVDNMINRLTTSGAVGVDELHVAVPYCFALGGMFPVRNCYWKICWSIVGDFDSKYGATRREEFVIGGQFENSR